MKLNINGETILVDFKYESDVRPVKEGDNPKYNRIRRHYLLEPVIDIVKVTCTIKRALFDDCIGTYICDIDKLNKAYARKISLKNALNNSLQNFKLLREDIWSAYFDNLIEELPVFKVEENNRTFETKPSGSCLAVYLKYECEGTKKDIDIVLDKQETQNLIKTLLKQVKYLH